MDRVTNAVFALLRAGLWMTEPNSKELFPLTDEEWTEVFEQSKKQTVSTLVLQGINMMNEEMMPSDQLLQRWAINIDHIEAENKKNKKAQDELTQWLKSLNLLPKVLKGHGAAALYEIPSQRVCGDIDIFFPTPGDHQKAWDAINKQGLKPKHDRYGAFTFLWKDVTIECHHRLLDISNPFSNRAIRKLIHQEADSENIYPTPLVHLLLLNAHILKHMLGLGMGLRQFADMARAYHRLKGQYNEKEYCEWCKRLNIERWTEELNGFLVEHLGLPIEDVPQGKMSSRSRNYIMQKVLTGGNFGFYGKTLTNGNASSLTKRFKTAKEIISDYHTKHYLAPRENIWMMIRLTKR